MRAIWNGAIGFGLVNIPVKLYAATETSTLDLDMLDSRDLSNIRFKRVNENTGKEVAWEDIVKGYKLKEEYVVLYDEDFEAASPEKSKLLSILQFVKERDIDPVYFETPYYIEPQKNGTSAYTLLLKALLKTKMAGIGSFVLREKEILCLIRPYDETKAAELKMAQTLIQSLEGTFEPEVYKNTYIADLMKIIKQKAKGKKIKVSRIAEPEREVTDLMAMLKASLKNSQKNAG